MNIKRILILALALMVLAMPIGFAEGGYGALTLSNFHLEVTGQDPLDIGASLKLGAGAQDDGVGRLDILVTGGGQTALNASLGVDAETLRAIIGGSTYVFEIPLESLQKALADAADGDAPNLSAEDIDKIKSLATGYVGMLRKYADPEASMKMMAPVLASLKAEAKGVETVDLFGQAVELNRFDVAMDAAAIGGMYDALFAADPEIKEYMINYFALMEKAVDDKIPLDPNDMAGSLETMMEKTEVDMTMDMSVWTDGTSLADENAKAIKQLVTVTVTGKDVAEGEAPISVSFPVEVSTLESDAGLRMSMNMAFTAPNDEGSLAMTFDGTFDAPGEDGATASSARMDMSFEAEDEDPFAVAMTFDKLKGADGVVDFSYGMSGTADEAAFDFSFAYDGATATETEKAGAVAITFNVPDEGVQGVFSCDALMETGAFNPLGDADFEGKTSINPLEASEEEMTQVQTELYGVMMQAYGVLLQTPGLSQIMGSMTDSGIAG